MRIKAIVACLLLATSAHAECIRPAPIDTTQAGIDDMRVYLRGMDAYATCLETGLPGMKPPANQAALANYPLVFTTMQQAVQSYNAAHE